MCQFENGPLLPSSVSLFYSRKWLFCERENPNFFSSLLRRSPSEIRLACRGFLQVWDLKTRRRKSICILKDWLAQGELPLMFMHQTFHNCPLNNFYLLRPFYVSNRIEFAECFVPTLVPQHFIFISIRYLISQVTPWIAGEVNNVNFLIFVHTTFPNLIIFIQCCIVVKKRNQFNGLTVDIMVIPCALSLAT